MEFLVLVVIKKQNEFILIQMLSALIFDPA